MSLASKSNIASMPNPLTELSRACYLAEHDVLTCKEGPKHFIRPTVIMINSDSGFRVAITAPKVFFLDDISRIPGLSAKIFILKRKWNASALVNH